ncbi:MAG: ParA family protein [Mailhella sp.]
MAIIISIATQKGGVGKTTTTVNLAHALASRPCSKKVLVIDMDPQANASSILGTVIPDEQPKGVTDLFVNKLKNASHCIVASKYKNVDLIASNLDLFVCGNTIAPGDPAAFMCLTKKLDQATLSAYDFIIIDCPPNIGGPFLNNALSCSDYYIIPVESSSIFSLNGVSQFLDAVSAIKGYTARKLNLLGVLMTMYDKRTMAAQNMLEVLEEKFGSKLFETKIIKSTDIDKSHIMNKTVIDYAPRANSAKCYKNLAIEIMHRCNMVGNDEVTQMLKDAAPY